MSKLIVEMEMPKDCPMCPMAHYNKLDEFTGCEVAAGKLFAATRDNAYAESASRPSWCPIKGVLPDEHTDIINSQPTVDAVQVVRCRECVHGLDSKRCGGANFDDNLIWCTHIGEYFTKDHI